MSHGHGHGHGHGAAAGGARGRLAVALALTVVVLGVQVAGAAASGSLALLADAGHVLTDALGLVLALVAATLARRPATPERTFGWQRAEVLAAMANGLLLAGVATYVLVEGVRRLVEPQPVDGGLMLVVAVVGLVVNAVALGVLTRGADPASLNLRGARLEVLGDLLGSAAVVVAAIVITATGWLVADAVASVAVALMVLPRVWLLLRDALDVLLEATPRHVDLAGVRAHARGVDGVLDVHDVHAWTITSGLPVLTAHVVVSDEVLSAGRAGAVLDQLQECLAHHFDVEHSTFQVEPAGHRAHERAAHD